MDRLFDSSWQRENIGFSDNIMKDCRRLACSYWLVASQKSQREIHAFVDVRVLDTTSPVNRINGCAYRRVNGCAYWGVNGCVYRGCSGVAWSLRPRSFGLELRLESFGLEASAWKLRPGSFGLEASAWKLRPGNSIRRAVSHMSARVRF